MKSMKKILSMFICLLMVLQVIPVGILTVFADEIPEGYTAVSNIEELYSVRYDLGGKYILTADIDMTADTAPGGDWDGGYGWMPIGENADSPFTGEFDGNGHTITGMQITDASIPYVGLFGYVTGSVCNFALKDVKITTSSRFTAGAVGYFAGTQLKNVKVSGSIDVNCSGDTGEQCYGYAGGITSYISSEAAVTECANEADINFKYSSCASKGCWDEYYAGYTEAYCGGISGYLSNVNAEINGCYNTGTIYTYSENSTNGYDGSSCWYCLGATANAYSYSGGITGYINAGNIVNCYNTAKIITAATSKASSTYSSAELTNNTYCYTGGINGYGGTVKTSVNLGEVTSENTSGEIHLSAISDGTLSNNYYLKGTAAAGKYNTADTASTAISLTAVQAKLKSVYGNLDFNDVWFLDTANGILHPQLINNPETDASATVVDTTAPSVTVENISTAAVEAAENRTVAVKITDKGGVSGYYWGKNATNAADSSKFTSINGSSKTVTLSLDGLSGGTYYISAVDASGNISAAQEVEFYALTFEAGAGASVTPSKAIVRAGEQVTLPTPVHQRNYLLKNWIVLYTGQSPFAITPVTEFLPEASCTLSAKWNYISVASDGITVDKPNSRVAVGDTAEINAILTPSNSTDDVVWETSNENIVTIEKTGPRKAKITGIVAGEATVTATSTSGKTVTCTVTVPDGIAPEVSISVTNNLANYQTVTVTVRDNYSVGGFYFGQNSDYTKNARIESNKSVNSKAVTEEGTYYITGFDGAGNVSETVNVTFYKTTLDADGGTIPVSSVLTMKGNTFNLPTPSKGGLVFEYWYSYDRAVSLPDKYGAYKPTGNYTLAASFIDTYVSATGIELNKSTLTLPVGTKSALTARVTPDDSNDIVTWSSNNLDVATVDSNGRITAVAIGKATIRATCGGYSSTCAVTVTEFTIPATKLSISKSSLELAVNGTANLSAVVEPSNTTDTLTWSSANDSVVSVDNTGYVVAKKSGSAILTAETSNGLKKTCTVTVSVVSIASTEVKLDRTEVGLLPKGSVTLTATIAPLNSTDEVKWSTSDATVATVYAGKVTALKTGTAVITAKTDSGKTAKCTVTVAEKTAFTWGEDNWSFNNNTLAYGSGTYRSMMSEEYLSKLAENLTPTEYVRIFGSADTAGYIDSNWVGSCYGMSALELLAKNGYINYSDYTEDAESLYGITKPKDNEEVRSLINYYHLLQARTAIQQLYKKTQYNTNKENITDIISKIDSDGLVLVGYQNGSNFAHAVLAYGHETGTFEKNGVTYQGRILICDPKTASSGNENNHIYYNTSTYNWTVPAYSYAGINSTQGAVFNCVLSDISLINYGGYLDGSNAVVSGDFIGRLNTVNVSGTSSVSKVTPVADGVYTTMNAAEGDIVPDYSFMAGGDSAPVAGYNIYDPYSAYRISQQTPAELKANMEYENCYLEAYSAAGLSADFDNAGVVAVKSESAAYTLSMTLNSDSPAEWFTVSVSGSGANEATLSKAETGWVLTGDNLKNVTVKANNRTDSATATFSTGCGSVLIYEIDSSTIGVLGDSDGDGTFETSIIGANKPAKILDFKATVGKSSITLAWDAAAGATSYYVYRNGLLYTKTSKTTYTDSKAVADKFYTYKVRAVNKGETNVYGEYTPEVSVKIIDKSKLSNGTVTLSVTAYTFNNIVKKPTVTVKNYEGKTLTNGTSYTVAYCCSAGCKTVGTHKVTVTAKGNYTGTVTQTFTIGKQPLADSRITLSATSYTYNTAVKKPTVTVKSSQGTTLTNGSSYTVTYCCSAGCKTVGTHKVTITGKGNYTGSITKTFKINKQQIIAARVSLSATSFTYDGAVKKPTVTVKASQGTVLTNGGSYTVKYCCTAGCKTVGTHKVTITGKGNYTGTVTKTFTIKKDLTAGTVTLSATSYTYNTVVKKPTVTVKNSAGTTLTNGSSYTVSYCCTAGCKTVGTHKVTVTGKGNYSGTVTKTFTIAKQPLVSSRITLSATSYTYDGAVKKPTVTVKTSQGTVLTNGSSYTVAYCCTAGCKTAGTHKVTITGKGNYTGTVTKTFTIKKDLTAGTATLSATSYTYNAAVKKPTVTVKNSAGTVITNGSSYTVSYCCSGGCKTAGTHTVTITGIGNYAGTIKKTFTINKQQIISARVTLSATSFTYNGAVKKPTVTVKTVQGTTLTNGSSYKVTYCCSGGCKTKGTHKVTVTAIGSNYSGTVTKSFAIK